MLTCFVAALALSQKAAIVVAPFSSWDGKSWSGIALDVPEKDLRKQLATSKTVGPDPASIRILADRKGWIVGGLLSDIKQRGELIGISIELERDEPIESLEAFEKEVGRPDFSAFPSIRYSDWSLAVWKDKGIAAVLKGGGRPLVHKVLLTSPTVLAKNLDLWPRDSTLVRREPRISVGGFDISISSDPRNTSVERLARDYVRSAAQSLMSSYSGGGWEPDSRSSNRLQISIRISKKKDKDFVIDETVSLSNRDELGDVSLNETGSQSAEKDIDVGRYSERLFDSLMRSLPKDIDEKYRLLTWHAEWRPFYGLAHR